MSQDAKLHYYLVTATVIYVREQDGKKTQKTKTLNAVVNTTKKLITYELMNTARLAVLQRCNEELGIQVNEIVDFVFYNWVYMGVMTQQEFQGAEVTAGEKMRASEAPTNPFEVN